MEFNATIAAYQAEQLIPLRDDRADIECDLHEYEQHNNPQMARDAENQVKGAIRSIELIAKGCANQLRNVADCAYGSEQFLRATQARIGKYRRPNVPDKLVSATFVSGCWAIEAGLTGISLVADGAAEIVTGLAFGGMFAGVNVSLGLGTGYFSRYLDYGLNNLVKYPADGFKRLLATAICFCGVLFGAFMNYVAGRVRITGDTHDIFSLAKAGIFETYSDALGLCIMAMAAISFGVAAYKGRSGFVDKSPELAEAANDARDNIDADADDIAESDLELIDEQRNNVEDTIFAVWPLPEDESALVKRIAQFKVDVSMAQENVQIFAQQEYERACFIAGKNIGKSVLDLGAFDALVTRLKIDARLRPNLDVLGELRAAHADASAAIMQAHADYLASVQSFRFPPPHSSTAK